MRSVLKNSIEVSVHANPIGEHLLLVVEERVGAEVLCIVNVFVDGGGGASAAGDGVCRGPHVTVTFPALHPFLYFAFLGQAWFGGRVSFCFSSLPLYIFLQNFIGL